MGGYESVIGLEVHVQLLTKSKIFTRASAAFGADPNSNIDELTFGLPGSLPVLNRKAVEFALMLGIALKCQIRKKSRFARKHYFYPDLPKGYQISQYDEPLCEQGSLVIEYEGGRRTIGITRIHLEEDAGKNMHDPRTAHSLVDLNRAGVPLLEIVTAPDIRSPQEAGIFLRTLRSIVRYLGISDGNMEEGSLRCDANVSIREKGALTFGERTEIKNMNSFRFVEKALEYEIARQLSLIKQGKRPIQETRLYDSAENVTKPMRSKEESADYRYFPEPDLPPLVVEEAWINDIKGRMSKLPSEYKEELINKYGLSEYDADVLIAEKENVLFFLKTVEVCNNPKAACNWITSELFGLLKKYGQELSQCKITPQMLGKLILLVNKGVISGKIAKEIFERMFKTGEDPEEIVKKEGIKQINSPEQILKWVKEVISKNKEQVK
ncbi:MAG: Asp-tRNA(Asn)/Glu-tRNA(Gln) amidotransferase subunit GatB, partial [Candidatus Dadabacteria bacterium]